MGENEVVFELKKVIIGLKNEPVKNLEKYADLVKENPTLSQSEAIAKCPDMRFGDMLPALIIQIKAKDAPETLKLWRLANKIEDKMITDKGELKVDKTLLDDLFSYVERSETVNTITGGPLLNYIRSLKEKLN